MEILYAQFGERKEKKLLHEAGINGNLTLLQEIEIYDSANSRANIQTTVVSFSLTHLQISLCIKLFH